MGLNAIGIGVGNILERHYKQVLAEKGKIATRRTINSINPSYKVTGDSVNIKVSADKGLFFIQSGKRANTKLPLKKSGDRFVLVDRLAEWKGAVGFGGTDYLLARAIAKKARKGIDITGIVIDRSKTELNKFISNEVVNEFRDVLVADIRQVFKF